VATTQSARYCDRCGGRLARDNSGMRCSACRSMRDALLKPPAVAREFWDNDQMRAALATWHMGRVIFAYRTHPQHPRPLSQEIVGNWLGLTQAQLSRIENGRAPEELSKLVRYAQILGIPGELLWFKLPEADTPGDTSTQRTTAPLALPAVVNGRSILLPIDAGAARAQGLDTLLNELADQGHAAHAVLSADEAELEHLAAVLNDARRHLDGSVVDFFRRQLDEGKTRDGNLGPTKALPLVLGVLGAISQHVREVKPDVRCALLSAGADGAEFAGWLYRDLQDPVTATYWYDRAMEWAQEAHDTTMQGYILLRKSQMAYDLRDAYRVVTFAEAAHQGPWRFPLTVRAEVAQQHALGLAMVGEPMDAVEREMDTARELLAAVAPDAGQPGPDATNFTMDTLLLRQATCYTEAGKPTKAAMVFGDVIASGKLSRRDAGFFSARRAAALALCGEPDEAAAVGLQAVETARKTSSERTMRLLSEVVRTLTPWTARPGPRALKRAVSASPR
jgi:transcriptional regulator with XRE-family HTH domain